MTDASYPHDYSKETQRKVAEELEGAIPLAEDLIAKLNRAAEALRSEENGKIPDFRFGVLSRETERILRELSQLKSRIDRYLEGNDRG